MQAEVDSLGPHPSGVKAWGPRLAPVADWPQGSQDTGWHVPGGLSVHVKSSTEADSSLQNNPGRGFLVGPRRHQLVSEAPQGLPHGAGQGGG